MKSPSVAKTPVHGDDLQSKLDGRIVGARNEDASMKESTVAFDIRFPALLPYSMEPAEMIIHLDLPGPAGAPAEFHHQICSEGGASHRQLPREPGEL